MFCNLKSVLVNGASCDSVVTNVSNSIPTSEIRKLVPREVKRGLVRGEEKG